MLTDADVNTSSAAVLLRQLTKDLEQAKKEVESKEDMVMMTRNDNERLRRLLTDAREDFRAQLEILAADKAKADARVMEAKLEAEREKSAKRDIQRELEEAVNDRERQSSTVADVRRQIDKKLSRLVEQLRTKEQENADLKAEVERQEKERIRLKDFEQKSQHKEEQLSALMAEFNTLQGEHKRVAVRETALQQEVEAFRLLHEHRESSQPSAASPIAPPLPPQQHPSSSSPARSILADPYYGAMVENPSLFLPSQLSFTKDVSKDLSVFSELAESLFDELTDLRTVLVRGAQASMDLVGTQSQDRKRLANMRRMQMNLASQAKHADEVEEVKALMQNSKENQVKLHLTLTSLLEFMKDVRGYVDRHCTVVGGLETLASVPRNARPQPWPQPGQGSENNTPPNQPLVPPARAATPQPSKQQHEELQEQLKQNVALVAELKESLASAKQENATFKASAQAAETRAVTAESAVKHLETSLAKAQQELELVRKHEQELEEKMREAQKQLQSAQTEVKDEREKAAKMVNELSREHDDAVRTTKREKETATRDLEKKYHTETLALETKLNEVTRQKEELTQLEAKRATESQRIKERYTALKVQKEELQEEIRNLKQNLVEVAKEARHYQDSVDVLSAELDCYKSAEQFEAAQRDQAVIDDFDDGVWTEWKNNAKRQQQQHQQPQHPLRVAGGGGSSSFLEPQIQVGSVGPKHSNIAPIKLVRTKAPSTAPASTSRVRSASRSGRPAFH